MNDARPRPSLTDTIYNGHPLAEKVSMPVPLRDLRIAIEGRSADGTLYRLEAVSEGTDSELLLVEVRPLDDPTLELAGIREPQAPDHHVALTAKLSETEDGVVYRVLEIRERTL